MCSIFIGVVFQEFPGSSQFEKSMYGTLGGIADFGSLSASTIAELFWSYLKCFVELCFEDVRVVCLLFS
jgi:hypothetical protein